MIEYLVKKRKITLLFFVAVTVFGVFSFFQLPRQEIPDVVISQAIVTTAYPGATPETVEQTVTKKIEQKIKEIQGVDQITSTSTEGLSSITVQLKSDVDPKEKWTELRSKMKDVESDLPGDAYQPVVNDDLIKTFISAYAITGESQQSLKQLNDLMTSWKDQLRTIPGISDVTISGLPDQEIRVDLDTQKMQQFNISWQQVLGAIQAETNLQPIGDMNYKNRNYQLILSADKDIDSLNNVIITLSQEGFPVYLKDIAAVALSHQEDTYIGYVNGKPAISLSISGEVGSDVPKLADLVEEEMDKLKDTLPEDYDFRLLYAQNDAINHMFGSLSKELIIAMIVVILVCMMGLNLVTSGIVALAIPLSITMGLIFLPFFGVTLNQMTIIGIIIVLSLLVDDAIVVNDNIERRLTEFKESPFDAAVKGTKEVIISIITATLATISAFAPLLFLQGDMGAFIRPIPFVITVALLASMVMSLTIVPIFRDWYESRNMHKRRASGKPAGFLGKQIQQLNRFYAHKLMPYVVQSPLKLGMIGLLIGTAGYGLAPFVPIELFPKEEDPQFTVDIEMPTGTSLAESDRIAREIALWAQKQPGVKDVSAASGGSAPQLFNTISASTGGEGAQIAVVGIAGEMDAEKTAVEWEKYLNKKYPGIPIVAQVASSGIPVGDPISIRITGPDIEQLRGLSAQIKSIIAKTDGTYDISDSLGAERYALEFNVDKQAMDRNLVSHTDLSTTLRLISQGVKVTQFDDGTNLFDINLYMENSEEDPSALFQRLSVVNALGKQIPISQLAEIKPSFSIKEIAHYNLERTVTITADVRSGTTATEAMNAILPQIENLNFPEGYKWEVGGETEQQTESFTDLGKLFVVCIFIILILITLQFYSLSIPLIILTTVYLAAAGGIIGMFITRTPIGFMSVMGITALAGIVVRNGIVLIEFIEDALHEGKYLAEAVLMATEARFRPILLTATAAVLGLLPVALVGDVLFRPMAVTIISGVIFSTVLTLFVVPALYMVLYDWKDKRKKKKAKKFEERLRKYAEKHKQPEQFVEEPQQLKQPKNEEVHV